MPRSGSTLLLIVLLLLPFAPGISGRARAAGAIENLKSQMLDQQREMHRLNKGIEDQKGMIRQSRHQELKLLTELEELEQQLLADRTRLAALKEQLNAQKDRLDRQQKKLEDLLGEQEQLATLVKRRLAAYYRMGKVGVLNALFSSSSLPDLLDVEEYLNRMLDHDRRTLAAFQSKIAEVKHAREEIAAEKERLAALYGEVQKQERQTTATQEKQMALLKRVRTEKKLHQVAVSEMEKVASQLDATLEKLREEEPPQAGQPGRANPKNGPAGDQDIAAFKGRLPPPVAGTVVTRFDEEVPGQFGIATRTHGIDIETEPGALIRAVFPGRVVYSGYLRGYGNLLIIDHGRQYYTLMSRAAKFLKEKNDEVRAGEVVGVMGGTSKLPPDGLHFEIRHGSEPENPLAWLDPKQLTVPPAGKAEKIQPNFTFLNRR